MELMDQCDVTGVEHTSIPLYSLSTVAEDLFVIFVHILQKVSVTNFLYILNIVSVSIHYFFLAASTASFGLLCNDITYCFKFLLPKVKISHLLLSKQIGQEFNTYRSYSLLSRTIFSQNF